MTDRDPPPARCDCGALADAEVPDPRTGRRPVCRACRFEANVRVDALRLHLARLAGRDDPPAPLRRAG